MSAVTQVHAPANMPDESPSTQPPKSPKTLASLINKTIPTFSGPCTATICPRTTPHDAGFYLHNGRPPARPQYTYPFGTSNPPPEIHAAYARVLAKCGSAEEILRAQLVVAAFLKLHASHLFVRAGDGTWAVADKKGAEMGEVADRRGAEMEDEVGETSEEERSSLEDGLSESTDATSLSERDLSEDELSEGEIRSSDDESEAHGHF